MSRSLHICVASALLGAGAWLAPASASAAGVGCGSSDNRSARCHTGWDDAVLDQQLSRSACIRGRTWGVEGGDIWVDRGCRGSFLRADRLRGRHGDRRSRYNDSRSRSSGAAHYASDLALMQEAWERADTVRGWELRDRARAQEAAERDWR